MFFLCCSVKPSTTPANFQPRNFGAFHHRLLFTVAKQFQFVHGQRRLFTWHCHFISTITQRSKILSDRIFLIPETSIFYSLFFIDQESVAKFAKWQFCMVLEKTYFKVLRVLYYITQKTIILLNIYLRDLLGN